MINTTSLKSWLADNASLLLILSVLVLFCTKTLFNIPLTIMAVIVIYRFVRQGRLLDKAMLWFFGALFLCLWLPMLFAFVDAANYTHSAKTVFPYLRYFLAGIYILQEINSAERVKKLLLGIFVITTVWYADALVQYLFGYNIFGQPYNAKAGLAGMFYPKIRLPHLLAVLAPICFEYVRRHPGPCYALWFTLPPFLLVHLLGGKRTAWMMMVVAVVAFIVYLLYSHRLHKGKCLLAVFVIIAVLGVTTLNDAFRHKVDKTLGLFSADVETVDEATARRISLWQIGSKVVADNWLNGVGPRGFRHIDTYYADADNFWVQGERHGQTHPHLFILEILIETGVIGFLGFVLFAVLILRLGWHKRTTPHVLPWLISIVVVLFPLNAHLAFYGSYWSSVSWWFVAVGLAAMRHDSGKN